jgi:hypothetical protein
MIHDKRSLAEILAAAWELPEQPVRRGKGFQRRLHQHEQELEGARSRTWVDASTDLRTETWVA